jgi:hypothetical protein
MKLTKQEAKLHQQARQLVDLSRDLTDDEKDFVLDNWQEAETATHGLDGAYFTPAGLAQDLDIEVGGDRIIDLCAGIGRLAHTCLDPWGRRYRGEPPAEIVCVERNPDYVRVGRKTVPEATWIEADVLALPDLGRFDTAISNPPFGAITRTGNAPHYTGRRFEYHVIDIAAGLADFGAFIIPQPSAPFRYSGEPSYREERDAECRRFERETGIRLSCGAAFDTSIHRDGWRGVSPKVEIVTADFDKAEPELEADDSGQTLVPLPASNLPAPRRSRRVVDVPLPA